jgi:hypothetical protein
MKILAAAGISAIFAVATADAQPAQPPAKPAPVCLNLDFEPHHIDHTHAVDPNTLLFYMRDGTIWKNTLKTPCPGLMFHGFEVTTHVEEICSNAQSISVLETGEVCQLGEFTPYTPPPAVH